MKKLVYFDEWQKGVTMPDYVEKTMKKNCVYKGQILTLRVDDACLPDGTPCTREFIDHVGGAGALYVEDGKVLLVRQFRYAYQESVLEIPAGKCNVGEDPSVTAARELLEETGVAVKKCSLLFETYPTPGYTNEKTYIYLAEEGERRAQRLDDGELVDVVWLPLDEAKTMLKNGQIKDAKTIIALQAYFLLDKKI